MEGLGVLFQFTGGLGMFLYGMNSMADGLQKSAGSRMQQLLGVLTSNRLLGVLIGAGITAIVQSSSATTVMVVGFVNAGMMNLTQAAGMIMGANIGTTVTSWIVSMSEWGEMLKPEFFAPLLVGIGAGIVLFGKDAKKRQMGEILTGFGFLFIGLDFMSSSIKPYRDAPVFAQAFSLLGKNPLLGIMAGAAVTAVIQSSSASVGILQTLALNGVVNWKSAVFITLGQNIGTCVTALLSCMGAHRTAKRAAVIHLLFNCVGAALFGVVMWGIFFFRPAFSASPINSVEISVFHTIFNVTNTIILFPFSSLLVKLSCILVKDRTETEDEKKKDLGLEAEMQRRLDSRILENPAFAIENAEQEVVQMGEVSLMNLRIAGEALLQNNTAEMEEVIENEKMINRMERMLTDYLVKINHLSLNEAQQLVVKNLFYTVSDIERIGDHSENLAELAGEKIQNQIYFSQKASADLREMLSAAAASVEHALSARKDHDMSKVRLVIQSEERVDSLEEDLREQHIERLSNQQCQTESGVIFLDAINNLERVSDHALNIAGYVRDEV
ncbi:MAG: Na/Pi cotransporter family protein [Lachnospiraceae bacterium]|nr:Na/Pi cotransporter family protein [Lachnospiraceae bacterium]